MSKKFSPSYFYLGLAALLGLLLVGSDSTVIAAISENSPPNTGQNIQRRAVDCVALKNVPLSSWNRHADSVRAICGGQLTQTTSAVESTSTVIPTTTVPHTSPAVLAVATTIASLDDPLAYGDTDVNVVPGEVASSHVSQAESFVWVNGCTVVVNYNDTTGVNSSNPQNISGVSYSTNCGQSFTRLYPSPFAPGAAGGDHGINYGDPFVVYNAKLHQWFAGDMVGGSPPSDCGGHGLGLWTSADAINWQVSSCAHINSAPYPSGDDRPSMWVDNNPSSAHYGRMYVSWNNGASNNGDLYVTYSDTGKSNSWTVVPIHIGSPFIRDAQITGSPDSSNSYVFLVGQELPGGADYDGVTHIYRSTDGGASWTELLLNSPSFPAPNDALCNLADVGIANIWRQEGYGQPGIGPNGVVHYVYTKRGANNDKGDIYYIRSTDNGNSWSVPMRLNTDTTNNSQWMPSLAVTAQGAVLASWYDRRDSSTGVSYKYFSRASLDNGATWQPDGPLSDPGGLGIPEPIGDTYAPCNAGDYNYDMAYGDTVYAAWTDGRNVLSGYNQEDIYFDKVTLQANGSCQVNGNYQIAEGAGSIVQAQPTTVVTTNCNPCTATVALPFNYTLYDQTFNSAIVGNNGTLGFVRNDNPPDNGCLPITPPNPFDYAILPYWDNLYIYNDANVGCTTAYPCGIYTSTSGAAPNRIFNIEWKACGHNPNSNWLNPQGAFPCGQGDTAPANFEVRLYEGQTKFDVIFGATTYNAGGATIGVQKDTGSQRIQYSCNTQLLAGVTRLTFTRPPECPPTPTPRPTSTYTPTYTPTYTRTPTPTYTPTYTPTACPPGADCGRYADVPPNDTFFTAIKCLTCREIVGGYPCGGVGEPCVCNSLPYFHPGNLITRGQLAKIVSNAAGYSETVTGQLYTDVPPEQTFYIWIMRLSNRGIMGGYPCGGPGEICDSQNRPYFRPYENATRSQLAKIVALAKGYASDPGSQVYQDVPTTDPFYTYINRLYHEYVMSGYPCGTLPQEPCVLPNNWPYFRPYYYTTRAQAAKTVYNAYPGCALSGDSPGYPGTLPGTPGTPQASVTVLPTSPPPSPSFPLGTATLPVASPSAMASPSTPPIPSPVQSVPVPVPTVHVPGPVPSVLASPVTTTIPMP